MHPRANNGRIADAIQTIQSHGDAFTSAWLRQRCHLSLKQAHNAISQAIARGVALRTARGRYRALSQGSAS